MLMKRRNKRRGKMMIRTASQAIDTAAGDARKANGAVADWLGVAQSTVSGWRERGISRNYAVHFYAELVERRGYHLAPEVFGLDSWRYVLMPDARGRKLRRVA